MGREVVARIRRSDTEVEETWEYAELEEGNPSSLEFSHRPTIYGEKWELIKLLGDGGFELVTAAVASGNSDDDLWRYVFKRSR